MIEERTKDKDNTLANCGEKVADTQNSHYYMSACSEIQSHDNDCHYHDSVKNLNYSVIHTHGGYVHTHEGEEHTHGEIIHAHATHCEVAHSHETHCEDTHTHETHSKEECSNEIRCENENKADEIAHEGYTHTHDGYTHSHDGHTHPAELDRNHKHANISEIHSRRQNELERSAETSVVCDDENTKHCREEYEKDKTDKGALIALGEALQRQLRYNEASVYYDKAVELYPNDYTARRKKAFCHMAILDTVVARKEFLWCEQRTDDMLDIKYRLACLAYYDRKYVEAKRLFCECYPLCAYRDEMYIAVLYWELLCDIRLKIDFKDTLKKYHADIKAGHHTGYLATVKLFLTGDDSGLLEMIGDDELNEAIYLFGRGCYLESIGDKEGAKASYSHALSHDLYFSSFAYLGLYSDKRHGIIE